LSLLKYSLKNKNGIFNLEEAALALEVEEITIKRALDFLRAEAFISYEYISHREVLITKNGEKNLGQANLNKKNLKNLLKESSAFKRFIKNKDAAKIENFISNLVAK